MEYAGNQKNAESAETSHIHAENIEKFESAARDIFDTDDQFTYEREGVYYTLGFEQALGVCRHHVQTIDSVGAIVMLRDMYARAQGLSVVDAAAFEASKKAGQEVYESRQKKIQQSLAESAINQ